MSEGELTDFLYPMIDGAEVDAEALLSDLAASALRKAATSASLTADSLAGLGGEIDEVADAIRVRVSRGGTVMTCGNGGSATDALSLASMLLAPPDGAPAVPARCLVQDVAVVTALANDIGVEAIFSRQVAAHAGPDDVLVALSTSGSSVNLLEAARAARRAGALAVGIAGGDGGRMRSDGDFDHVLVVRSDSVHRIQEAQARVGLELVRRIHHDGGAT